MKKLFSILFLLITFTSVAQTYAPKKYYLVDSLVLNELSKSDRQLVDSCLKNYHKAKDDTSKVKALTDICENMMHEVWKEYQYYQYRLIEQSLAANPPIKIAKTLKIDLANALNNLGFIQMNINGNNKLALEYFLKSLKINEELIDKKSTAQSYNNIGNIYTNQGNFPKALAYCYKSLKLKEEIEDKKGMAQSYNNIGAIHKSQGDVFLAKKFYLKSLKIREEIKDKQGMADSYNNIGALHYDQKDFDSSIEYYLKSLRIQEEIGNKQGMSRSYNNIGNIYSTHENLHLALEFHLKSLKINEDIGDKQGMVASYTNIGNIYFKLGDFLSAQEYGKKSIILSKEINYPEEIKYAAILLSQVYEKQGKGTEALVMYKLFVQMKDTISNEETRKATVQQQVKYEYEKQKVIDDAKNDKLIAVEKEAKEKQLVITYATGTGLGLVGIFLFFVITRLQLTRKQKKLIEKQKHEVEQQKEIIEHAHGLLEGKNKEITDSIRYAKRIQNAILPPAKLVKQYLPQSFILYKPKDIVAGDFYWMESLSAIDSHQSTVHSSQSSVHSELSTENRELILFAAADCTGHGVPGAMVSVVCNNGLNRSVREHGLTDPGEILNKTREIVIAEFEKSDEDVKDGMDIALCSLEFKVQSSELTEHQTSTELASSTKLNIKPETVALLQYAGANNPLWIIRPVIASATACPDFSGKQSLQKEQIASLPLGVRNDVNFELIEFKPNKQPIGKFDNPEPYTTHTFELQKGDSIYIFSDGYVDQFGGEKGKKFKIQAFRKLLLSIQDKPMDEQRYFIDEAFENWKGSLDQIDDVCIIGVRI